jgi:2-isopropylmalate synthase
MAVPPRQPYAGEYVFTAFSGTHQDAIRKGIHRLAEAPQRFGMEWKVPYLHIDPADVGRRYERLIRINAQSGKGGMAWVLEQDYGLELPRDLLPELGRAVQAEADRTGAEMSSERIYEIFIRTFVDVKGSVELTGYWPRPDETDPGTVQGDVTLTVNGHERRASAAGNGPVSAFVNALSAIGVDGFTVEGYQEQALGRGADARAVAYVPLRFDDGALRFGVGVDTNIEQAAVRAVVAGLNRRDETLRR